MKARKEVHEYPNKPLKVLMDKIKDNNSFVGL
jgi:hypothetical protein